jgi:alkanesulfonate monooxygenase SsuD/methylene tetrahydromethanopterin reductase-like flavin-dependent oxidoreductase (luciferase family)
MANGLSFGFLYDFRNPPEWRKPFVDLYAEALDFIEWTESIGFDGAWVPEHHSTDEGYVPSPLVALAAIAARTKKMKLGTGVALAAFYHPVRFAEDCAMIDVISNGRLEIALALGYRKRETDAYGVDFRSRTSRLDEFLQIVRRLWAGETVTFEGKHFNIRNAALMPQPVRGHIPLFVGAYSDKGLIRAAKYADGYFGANELYGTYLGKLQEYGKPLSSARFYQATLPMVVTHDPERAMDELAPYYLYVNNRYGVWMSEDQLGVEVDEPPRPLTLEEFKASGLFPVMTPAQAIELFRDMRERTNVEHVTIPVPPGLPISKFANYAETFAKEVIPAFE